jgi:hypothetical protein
VYSLRNVKKERKRFVFELFTCQFFSIPLPDQNVYTIINCSLPCATLLLLAVYINILYRNVRNTRLRDFDREINLPNIKLDVDTHIYIFYMFLITLNCY